jgi:hypothetical protein
MHQRLLSAGVVQQIADLITGHADASMYALYAQVAAVQVLAEAVEKVRYGEGVESLVARRVADRRG